MNQLDTFIALPRNFPKWFCLYDKILYVQVYIYILLKASYQQIDLFGSTPIYRGQLKTTYKEICDSLGINFGVLRWCIKNLVENNYITVESKSTVYTIFTVRGYENFSPQYIPNGWVKLYRNILNEPWFKDPEVFYVYLSLLVRLSDEEETLSYKDLCDQRILSNRKVLSCLQLLRKYGVINYKKKPYQDMIAVRLCTELLTVQQQKTSKRTAKEQQKNDKTRNILSYTSQLKVENVSLSDSENYEIENGTYSKRTAKEQQKIIEGSHYNCDTFVHNSEDSTSIYNNIEREKKKRVCDAYAHAYENFAKELKSDASWKKLVGIYFQSLDLTKLSALIDRFVVCLEIKDKRHNTLQEFKDHFICWLNKEIASDTKMQNISANADSNRCSTELASSGWEIKPLTKAEQEQKDARERLRLQRFIELSKDKNCPSASSCINELTEKYYDGTLKRLGIDWKPPE